LKNYTLPFLFSILSPLLSLIAVALLDIYINVVPPSVDHAREVMNILIVVLLINPLIGLVCSFFIKKKKFKILLVIINLIFSILFVIPMILLSAFIYGEASFAP
jgi:hypothetical protein